MAETQKICFTNERVLNLSHLIPHFQTLAD